MFGGRGAWIIGVVAVFAVAPGAAWGSAPRNGLISGCYPLDKHYTGKPEFQKLKEIKKATGT